MAVLLAVSDNDFFKSNFSALIETLLKVKDKTVRPFALEALRYIMVAYLSRNVESSEEVFHQIYCTYFLRILLGL